MIRVIDINSRPADPTPEGSVKRVLDPQADRTRVHVAVHEIGPGRTWRLGASPRTQVVYVLEGADARLEVTAAGRTEERSVPRRAGAYLEPGDTAALTAGRAPVTALLVTVPKHTGKPPADGAAGYFFDEAQLRSLVDEKRFRERTFWVNRETGLSGSWDMQLGRMRYAPRAHSPRHVHRPSKAGSVVPEHFYLIEEGIGEVRHDGGSMPVGPGSLVLIPAGEWHQLVASDTGFDYIEFQAPFDFVTTMDHDPLGKNWYIKGTDDGTGKPQLWVQS